MKKKYIVGNWKMFKTVESAKNDFSVLNQLLSQNTHITCDVGICPPTLFLNALSAEKSSITLYAQNTHWENEGAFTGETSIRMLKSANIDGSLVAHSERRQYFNETNETAGKKINALIKNNMKVIYCVGESLEERESGKVYDVIKTQLKDAFSQCKKSTLELIQSNLEKMPVSVAYEPVWAIGTGKAATPKDAHDVHTYIRKELAEIFNQETANSIQILYGGSVKPENIKDYLTDDEIDGALVGGASLDPKVFFELCSLVSL